MCAARSVGVLFDSPAGFKLYLLHESTTFRRLPATAQYTSQTKGRLGIRPLPDVQCRCTATLAVCTRVYVSAWRGGTSFTRRQGLAVDAEVRTSPNANLPALPGASPLKIIATGQNKLPYTYPRAFKGRARVRRPFYNVISNTEAFGDSTGFCATGWAGSGPLFLSRIHWGPFGYRARPSVR